jgi:hypothetical protein
MLRYAYLACVVYSLITFMVGVRVTSSVYRWEHEFSIYTSEIHDLYLEINCILRRLSCALFQELHSCR